MKKIAVTFISIMWILISCSSTQDMEKNINREDFYDRENSSVEESIQKDEAEMKGYMIQEELKVQDIEDTVVYIDRPVYIPVQKDVPELEKGYRTGYDAVVDSQKRATVRPENYKDGTFWYTYDDNLVYEIYAQPYHLTDIVLEKGEIVKNDPLFSEDDSVWELTAGVSVDPATGEDVQHFFVKPAYSKLDSSLIIITNRRVYHLRIKSYADTHMAIVRFTYPRRKNQYAQTPEEKEKSRTAENDYIRISNPALLSFDYKIKYSMFDKPEFLPTRVYDDGQSTYIQVQDIVLQKKLPVLFNEKNEIENYSVNKNVFTVPRLINKLTLRLGKQKVIIEKKKISKKKAEQIVAEQEEK